ncbi:unnamed protein product [Rotaria sp. Silwood2]|nr:unnamed protein product [Rotaria sp. Silwood2]CAF3970978.1 unnamed protein product [Rotaria sp. Silwood2]
MEFKNSIEESGDEDDEDDEEFPPLPSDIDLPSHTNTPDPYDNRHRTVEFFYCPSPPLPSPPLPSPPQLPLLTSSVTMARIYANARTLTSIRNPNSINQPTISFATQQKKKGRAPVAGLLQSVYVNIPISPSPSLPPKPVNISNEVTYATLMNTTSMAPSISSDLTTNHVEYQQIHIQNETDKIKHSRIYENIKSNRPPPPPYYSQAKFSQRTSSLSVTPLEVDKSLSHSKILNNQIISPSSAHIYINLECHDDKPPIIPTRTTKQSPITIQMSPPPPVIPPRNEQKDDFHSSSTNLITSPVEKEQDEGDTNVLETSSNASSVQTVKELEVNMAPSCDDKSDLYRTKMSINTTENIPSFLNARQRRLLHGTRRRRLRGSLAFRGSIALRSSTRGSINHNTNRQQYSRSNSNIIVRHPMVTDDRWRRTLRKRRRQRAVQMKLDGNILHQQMKSTRPISDHTYNEIKQPILANNRMRTNGHNGSAGGVLERAMQFNGALRDRVFSWYRGANHNNREQQQQQQQEQETTPPNGSTSDNGESDQKGTATNEDEEEEEFFTHDTFEDFLLRRRPKSSASTTVSGTSTIVSQVESISQRLPVRKLPNQKVHIPPLPPPPPPPPPPLPPTPPPARRFPGLALSLDKTDVDFIHNILQRTRGEHRVWNRITALKEAYIRATSKKKDLPKKPKNSLNQIDEKKKKKSTTMKHSLAATKIRAELEKYDELPASSATILDDDYYYDETCSVNDHHKINHNLHNRSIPALPQIPSTTNRILNFVVSIKRRAQNNVQQLQKNLQDIRSRVNIEAMGIPPNQISIQRHTSIASRQRQTQTLKDSSNTPRIHLSRVETTLNQNTLVRRTNSHHSGTSTERSNALHRRQLNRTQSNASQLPQQLPIHHHHHRHRVTNDKTLGGVGDRSPSLTTRPPPFERHSSRQTQNGATVRQQRTKNSS